MKSTIVISSAVFAALIGIATPSMARHELQGSGAEAIALKDGSTLYVFKDGKMAREDKYGHATPMKMGQTVEAIDGRVLTITSSESARLHGLLNRGEGGN